MGPISQRRFFTPTVCPRRSSAYITQDDRLQPLLTVMENMHVAADLKLGTDTPRYEKETIVSIVLGRIAGRSSPTN